MELTPSDAVLLAASRFAPLGLSERVGEEIGKVWQRFGSNDHPLLEKVDAPKLERTVFAAALLANEQQGLLRLVPDGIEVRAEPTGLPSPWPKGSLEQGLLRSRALPVSQLVSDWRGQQPLTLLQVVTSARERGLLQINPSRTGPFYIPAAAALAAPGALDGEATARLLEDYRVRRPELWKALQAEINDGISNEASAPDRRFDAGALSDSISLAELKDRQEMLKIPAGTKKLGSLAVAVMWTPAVALYAVLPQPWADFAPPRWPAVVAAAVTAAVLIFDRGYRPAEPVPEAGMSDEETTLFRERSFSSRHPSWRESLTNAAAAAAFIWWFGLLCLIDWPLGHLIYTGLVLVLVAGIIGRVRLGRLPSAREVELAVARRSRALTAAYKAEPDGDEAAPPLVTAAAPRPWREISASDLPPPSPAARARTDQRRRAALFVLRRSAIAFALLLAGEVLLTVTFWLRMEYDPMLLIFVAVVPGFALFIGARNVADAWYRLRPAALQRDESWVARALRVASIADGRLRRLLAAEPEFWRDEELQVRSPLGVAPALGLAYWFVFVAIAFLIVPLAQGKMEEGLAFTAAGLALAAGFMAYRRGTPAALARQVRFEPGVRLLMLRVFGSPSFDELVSLIKPWLLVGPISHLEGYDSIVRSPEAREKLAEGRLDEVLIKSPEELAAKMAAETGAVGDDFHYRRSAFQCTDAVWKIAIRQMLDRSEVVVMDLSNLGPANLGCAYELGLLLNRVKLSRVLLLVSETTDRDCLRTILDHAAARLAPDCANSDDPDQPWQLLRIGGSTAAQPDESYLDWVRRLDNRIDPMELVSHLLDMALAAPASADPPFRPAGNPAAAATSPR